jgi:hypothetical protein
MGAPNTLKNAFFNHFFRNTAQTPAAALYLACLTAVASESAGTVTEVSTSGTAYERQAITFTAPSTGAVENTASITFPIATANQGTVTHYGVYDAATAGNLLFIVALGTARTINNTEQLVVAAGDVDLLAS